MKNIIFLGLISFFMDISSEMVYPMIPLYLIPAFGATPFACRTERNHAGTAFYHCRNSITSGKCNLWFFMGILWKCGSICFRGFHVCACCVFTYSFLFCMMIEPKTPKKYGFAFEGKKVLIGSPSFDVLLPYFANRSQSRINYVITR